MRNSVPAWWLAACLAAGVLPGSALAEASGGPVASEEVPAEVAAPLPEDFNGLATALIDADFEQRQAIVLKLAALPDPRALPLLGALLDGRLYSSADTPPRIASLAAEGEDPAATDALSGADMGPSSALTLDSIPVNNALRGQLHTLIARLQLSSPDSGLRLAAARRLVTTEADPQILPLLQQALKTETDSDVKASLATVIAMADIASDDIATRQAAVQVLSARSTPKCAPSWERWPRAIPPRP